MRFPVMPTLAPLCLALSLLASSPSANAAPASAVKRGDVSYLQTPAGQTLYTYSKDRPGTGQSDCDKQCARAWPPFIAAKGGKAEGWTVISREDGQPQWAYKGRPLYMFFKDEHPGEMHGQNYEGHTWQVASP